MLTDKHISKTISDFVGWGSLPHSLDEGLCHFARAIESAVCTPLLERIAELEAKLAQRVPDGRLHDDGYFTWNPKRHPNGQRPVQLPTDFWLSAAPAAPEQAEPVTKEMWRQLAESQAELLSMGTTQQAEARPVAYIRRDQLQKASREGYLCEVSPKPRQDRVPIYTAQPKAVPLTEAQRTAIVWRAGDITEGLNQDDFADEIIKLTEAAHGIGTGD